MPPQCARRAPLICTWDNRFKWKHHTQKPSGITVLRGSSAEYAVIGIVQARGALFEHERRIAGSSKAGQTTPDMYTSNRHQERRSVSGAGMGWHTTTVVPIVSTLFASSSIVPSLSIACWFLKKMSSQNTCAEHLLPMSSHVPLRRQPSSSSSSADLGGTGHCVKNETAGTHTCGTIRPSSQALPAKVSFV